MSMHECSGQKHPGECTTAAYAARRKSRFRQFKERLALQTKKLGELKSAGAGKGKSKKQERLENSMKVVTFW